MGDSGKQGVPKIGIWKLSTCHSV